MDSEPQTRIAAEDYLDALAAHGIDHLFCNPGTDFAPIVEAFSRAARTNRKVPRPMVVPHENAALSMAHGYTMITGKPQAVMLHTNVGTANSINMLIDASRDRVPVLLTSGRTPFTESGAEGFAQCAHSLGAGDGRSGRHAARDGEVGLREMKRGDQAASVVDRALELAMTSPKGPVYLSLPREVLGEVVQVSAESAHARRIVPRAPVPSSHRHRTACRLDRIVARTGGHHRSAWTGSTRCSGAVAAGRAVGTPGHPVYQSLFRDRHGPSDVPGFLARAVAGGCRSWSSSSSPTCRGCRAKRRRRRERESYRSVRTHYTPATRCAASHVIWRSLRRLCRCWRRWRRRCKAAPVLLSMHAVRASCSLRVRRNCMHTGVRRWNRQERGSKNTLVWI